MHARCCRSSTVRFEASARLQLNDVADGVSRQITGTSRVPPPRPGNPWVSTPDVDGSTRLQVVRM